MENNFKMGLKFTPQELPSNKENKKEETIKPVKHVVEEPKPFVETEKSMDVKKIEKTLMLRVEKAGSVREVIQILKDEQYEDFLKQNYQTSKMSNLNIETILSDTSLNKSIRQKIKKMYQSKLKENIGRDEILKMANEFKELRCMEDETRIPNLYGLSELSAKIGDKLIDNQVVYVPENNVNLRNAIRDQFMTAAYVEGGRMHGNHIEEMELSQVYLEGRTDYFLMENGEILSILNTTGNVETRTDRHKLTEPEYTDEFTPQVLEMIKENATLLVEKQKSKPLQNIYDEIPEIKLKDGVTPLDQRNYIPKARGRQQIQ